MKLTFRWYGPDDPVSLENIRQISGMQGVVTALHEYEPGEVWPESDVRERKARIERHGLEFSVVESVPVHEDVKLGRPSRDEHLEVYRQTIRHLGAAGVPVVCYNFMPVFDWTRTDLSRPLEDGSTALSYDHEELAEIDLSAGTGELPGWGSAYSSDELEELLVAYEEVDEEDLWDHLRYFLEAVVPAAEESGVALAIHPDDPPWSIFGLPRIVTDEAALERLIGLVDSPAHGLTFCTGSLGPRAENDLPRMIRRFGGAGRIHFGHCRNVRRLGERSFTEVPHPSAEGDVDMYRVLEAYRSVGFDGPIRPDHGRMIWGETGRPGYGLYDRALGGAYLNGVWEALERG